MLQGDKELTRELLKSHRQCQGSLLICKTTVVNWIRSYAVSMRGGVASHDKHEPFGVVTQLLYCSQSVSLWCSCCGVSVSGPLFSWCLETSAGELCWGKRVTGPCFEINSPAPGPWPAWSLVLVCHTTYIFCMTLLPWYIFSLNGWKQVAMDKTSQIHKQNNHFPFISGAPRAFGTQLSRGDYHSPTVFVINALCAESVHLWFVVSFLLGKKIPVSILKKSRFSWW